MTLHGKDDQVGVRELHDRLSEYLDRVQRGSDVVVTRRGRPIARLSAVESDDALEELVRRGLVDGADSVAAIEAAAGEVARLGLGPGRRAAALNLYFDTSALIKLVVAEDGSDLVAELWETRHPAASSILAYPEGRAALAAAQRGGRLTAADHVKAVEDFETIQDELVLIGVDVPLAPGG